MLLKITEIKIDPDRLAGLELPHLAAESLGLSPEEIIDCQIVHRSVDSRRGAPKIVLTLQAEVLKTPHRGNWKECEEITSELQIPDLAGKKLAPIIVGTGPAGIFAALVLARAGARPLVLDRGSEVGERQRSYTAFLKSRELDEENNLLIGEGGAGTFSDGKLYTGTRNCAHRFILKTYAEAAGLPEVEYLQRPHLGSDKLAAAAIAMRQKIIAAGGTFRFGVKVEDVWVENGRCSGVITSTGEKISGSHIILAPGLGARELAGKLIKRGVDCQMKNFQLGCRVEHPQKLIDRHLYHLPSRPEALGAAEYHWVSRPANAPHVASFCMCPGGEVVMASAWRNQLTTNGMSYYRRDGEFANSALVTTIGQEVFANPFAAWDFLSGLERQAFELGGGNYAFPAQDIIGFLREEVQLKNYRSSVKTDLVGARVDKLLPAELGSGVRSAVKYFERFCPGFIKEGKLIGQESCISSPVRFLRNPETLESTNIPRLYIGGEFAGLAGGIVSAAADGVRLALAIGQD